MKTFDNVILWVKQIVLDINITANNAVDLLFVPVYGLIEFIDNTIHQWATKPNTEHTNNEHKQIGFNH